MTSALDARKVGAIFAGHMGIVQMEVRHKKVIGHVFVPSFPRVCLLFMQHPSFNKESNALRSINRKTSKTSVSLTLQGIRHNKMTQVWPRNTSD